MSRGRRALDAVFVGLVAVAGSGCVHASGFQDGGPGRAYLVETHHYLIASRTTVWSCDATGGAPQCWRVVEKETP